MEADRAQTQSFSVCADIYSILQSASIIEKKNNHINYIFIPEEVFKAIGILKDILIIDFE